MDKAEMIALMAAAVFPTPCIASVKEAVDVAEDIWKEVLKRNP